MKEFPKRKGDDAVDAATQALRMLYSAEQHRIFLASERLATIGARLNTVFAVGALLAAPALGYALITMNAAAGWVFLTLMVCYIVGRLGYVAIGLRWMRITGNTDMSDYRMAVRDKMPRSLRKVAG